LAAGSNKPTGRNSSHNTVNGQLYAFSAAVLESTARSAARLSSTLTTYATGRLVVINYFGGYQIFYLSCPVRGS
jgi:hypothetical protein